ncbi:MAG: fatty acyl-AMP ligase [Proteobacteria bacterium]|jgi:acyl-CoA synthetase (AMP-forming)/AMP-acid ligase II|nr:fatty acyl-AMP ligase [Pseudomonadota bacterium]
MSAGPRTVVDAVRRWAQVRPDAVAFRFLTEHGAEVKELSFGALDLEARRIGAELLDSARPGDRAAIVCTSEEAFVRAFFGSLYAGLIPVPALPPSPRRENGRLHALLADCHPSVVLTHARVGEVSRKRVASMGGFDDLRWMDVDDPGGAGPGAFCPPRIAGGGAALLQYTSGSTALPRGVAITHDNMVANCLALSAGFGFAVEDLAPLAWLPLFHDMGLLGHVVMPAYFGVASTLMPSHDFLQQPASWLAALSAYRATYSLSPNFAYDLCVERVSAEQKAGLDLGAWRWAGNGAEPVRLGTMERFAAAFAGCGFDIRQFFPCYGLAEATLFAAGGPEGSAPDVCRASRAALLDNRIIEVADGEPEPAVGLVSSGRVRADSASRIVDPVSGRSLGEMEVGEIWLSGPSVASGYWNRPDESREIFEATCGDGGRYLRTGDLGFTRGGALFVCGRSKDVVILDGSNHHAQDLEQSIEGCHPALRENGCAAFSVDADDREVLIAACEIRKSMLRGVDRAEVMGAIREALAGVHGVRLHNAVLLGPGRLPRTTSGKVMRRACRRMYLEGTLAAGGGERDERDGSEDRG